MLCQECAHCKGEAEHAGVMFTEVITIGRKIDTPGHGKDVVKGLNTQDKMCLRKARRSKDKIRVKNRLRRGQQN